MASYKEKYLKAAEQSRVSGSALVPLLKFRPNTAENLQLILFYPSPGSTRIIGIVQQVFRGAVVAKTVAEAAKEEKKRSPPQ